VESSFLCAQFVGLEIQFAPANLNQLQRILSSTERPFPPSTTRKDTLALRHRSIDE